MSLVSPELVAKESDADNVCMPEHCFYAFDTLYCNLTRAKSIPPTFLNDK
jgi:AMME syndrome candidate gene 1 protein